MGRCADGADARKKRQIEKWARVRLPELLPVEVSESQLILRLCERFHKLPSEVMAESSYLLYLLRIESMTREKERGE